MSLPPRPDRDRAGDLVRAVLVVALAAAPLAMGAVHEATFVPLLLLFAAAGAFAWRRARAARRWGHDAPTLPGRRLLLGLHAVVLAQLVPLPPGVLALVSPGSFASYDAAALLPLDGWRPVSVNPADTARGLAFLAGMSLLYLAVFHEFRDQRWRRRLCFAVAGAGVALTVAALLQAVSAQPTRIYGLWQPRWDWAVFGPYVSRNHFAGYLAMAIPLALAFLAETVQTWRTQRRRRRLLVALSMPEATAAACWAAAGMLLLAGLLASRSRGGLLAFGVGAAALPFALRRRRQAAVLLAAVVLAALAWVDVQPTVAAFEKRGLRASRVDLWLDTLPMVRRAPLLGHGFNAFGTAYPRYQTVNRIEWYGEAHNEYLQLLLDTGLAGAALGAGLLLVLLRRAIRASGLGALDAGALASLVALCVHNLVDFDWQIPANAATFVALAAVAARRGDPALEGWESRAPRALNGAGQEPARSEGRPRGSRT